MKNNVTKVLCWCYMLLNWLFILLVILFLLFLLYKGAADVYNMYNRHLEKKLNTITI